MYLEKFGLHKPPFRITPDTDAFYTGGERGAILRAILYAILSGDAIIKIVGEVGSGKTMLCRMLETKLPDSVDIVYLGNPRLTPDNILQAVAFELDIPINHHEATSRVLMLKSLQENLLEKHAQDRRIVVFVEEAQSMPLETLEEIRLLSNLETNSQKLLQVVLFGQPELDKNLCAEHVRQIRDRISNSFYLPPLKKREVEDYLMYRLYAAGHKGAHLFSGPAISLLTKASRGFMRKINILAEKAILASLGDGACLVKRKHVAKAIKDAQFSLAPNQSKPWLTAAATFASIVGISLSLLWIIYSPIGAGENLDINQLPAPQAGLKSTNLTKKSSTLKAVNSTFQVNDIIQLRRTHTQSWLAKVNPDHFSIQVLLTDADSITGLERFLSQDGITSVLAELFIFNTHMRDEPVIRVLYGEYKTYQEARNALEQLPAPLRRYYPYILNIKTIHPTAISDGKGITRDSS